MELITVRRRICPATVGTPWQVARAGGDLDEPSPGRRWCGVLAISDPSRATRGDPQVEPNAVRRFEPNGSFPGANEPVTAPAGR